MSPAETRRMIERLIHPAARIGTVTTGGATPVVALDGAGPITVRYIAQGLVLAAGERVLAIRTAGGVWVVTDRLTTPAAVTPPVVRRFTTVNAWRKVAPLDAADNAWTVQLTEDPAYIYQGQDYFNSSDPSPPPNKNATVLYFGALASLVPSGSTILDVSLAFTRNKITTTPPLVNPRLYGSLYSTGSPPTLANAPAAVSGFGPLAGVAAVARGQSTTIGLPASWITAWLAGTITSLHLYSDSRDDALFSYSDTTPEDDVQLIVTYQPPPEA